MKLKDALNEELYKHLDYKGYKGKQYSYDVFKNPTKEEMETVWKTNTEPIAFIDTKTSDLYIADYEYSLHIWLLDNLPEFKGKNLIMIRPSKEGIRITSSTRVFNIPKQISELVVRKNKHLIPFYPDGMNISFWYEDIDKKVKL